MKNKLPLKRLRVPILVVLVLLSVYLFKTEPLGQESKERSIKRVEKQTNGVPKDTLVSKPSKPSLPSSDLSSPQLPEDIENYSFTNEIEKIKELNKEFPQSKAQIFQIVVQEDYFKENKIIIEPHSRNEKLQSKMGAAKVLALKSLLTNEKDTNQVRQDLNQVIQQAKDPTIVKIAEAARDSLDQGRSFFDDFIEGVAQLPL